MKQLQDIINHKCMSVKECFNALKWTFIENGEEYEDIKCPCGGELMFIGFFGTEKIECDKCGKHMQYLYSFLPVSNSTATCVSRSEYECEKDNEGNDRCWVAINPNENRVVEE